MNPIGDESYVLFGDEGRGPGNEAFPLAIPLSVVFKMEGLGSTIVMDRRRAFITRRFPEPEADRVRRNNEFSESRPMETKTVLLMRGLPSCGKSHTARRLAGPNGIVLETDQYFYTQVGEDPGSYDYSEEMLDDARQWNLNRFDNALAHEVSPIVVDRGNGLNAESRAYVVKARAHGYHVELREPDSPWWIELRVLLKYKQYVSPELFDQWAEALAKRSRETHRVPAKTIRRWMQSWRSGLTIDDILASDEPD